MNTPSGKVYEILHEAVDNWSIERQVDHPHPLSVQRTKMLHSLAVKEIDAWQRQERRKRLGEASA